MRLLAIAAALLAVHAGAARAQTIVTLDDALARASGAQPSLRSARANVEGARARREVVEAGYRPTISTSASAGVAAANPPDLADPYGSLDADLTVRWTIWDFGRRALSLRSASAEIRASEADAIGTNRDVARTVTDAYLSAVACRRKLEVASARVAAEERHVDETRRFVEAQARASIELAQVESALAQATLTRVRTEGECDQARSTLEAAIGVEIAGDWDVEDRWPDAVEGEDGTLASLLSLARQESDDVQAAEARRDRAAAALALDRIEWRPTLDLSAQARAQTTTDDLAAWNEAWSVGVTLSWTLWDGGARAARVREARADLAVAEAERDGLVIDLRKQVDSARLTVRTAKAEQVAAAASAKSAEEQLRLAEARYEAGAGSAIELADAQDDVTTAAADVVDADLHLAQARTALARLITAR